MSSPGIGNVATNFTDATQGQSGTMSAQRNIGGIVANVTVEEEGEDELEITQHPVERTADITDHAYKLPSRLRVKVGYSPSGSGSAGAYGAIDGAGDPVPLQTVYQQYLDMQTNRKLLEVQTGKRLYQNMLIKGITLVTDKDTENALFLSIYLQEVILVDTQTVQVPSNSVQKNPSTTGNTLDAGTKNAVPNPGSYNPNGGP